MRHDAGAVLPVVRRARAARGGLALCLFLLPAAGLAAQAPTYEGGSPDHPRVRFADGDLSLNDRCPVRRNKLNLRMPPVYVNGRPIGFC
jgi:hypothetical protein